MTSRRSRRRMSPSWHPNSMKRRIASRSGPERSGLSVARCSTTSSTARITASSVTCRCSPVRTSSPAEPVGRASLLRSIRNMSRNEKMSVTAWCAPRSPARAAVHTSATSFPTARLRPETGTASTRLRFGSWKNHRHPGNGRASNIRPTRFAPALVGAVSTLRFSSRRACGRKRGVCDQTHAPTPGRGHRDHQRARRPRGPRRSPARGGGSRSMSPADRRSFAG